MSQSQALELTTFRRILLHYEQGQRSLVWDTLRQYARGELAQPDGPGDRELSDAGVNQHLVSRLQEADVAWTVGDLYRIGWSGVAHYLYRDHANWQARLGTVLTANGYDAEAWKER